MRTLRKTIVIKMPFENSFGGVLGWKPYYKEGRKEEVNGREMEAERAYYLRSKIIYCM